MSYDAIADAIPAMTYEEQLNLLTTLVEAIKAHIPNKQTTVSQKKTDYTDSYPPGYFERGYDLDSCSFAYERYVLSYTSHCAT